MHNSIRQIYSFVFTTETCAQSATGESKKWNGCTTVLFKTSRVDGRKTFSQLLSKMFMFNNQKLSQ